MNLTILGGTGGTGRLAVQQALAQGHTVTVLARTPAKLKLEDPRLTVVQGDARDAAAVSRVVKGQDAVLVCLGPSGRADWDLELVATRHVLDAMAAHSVRRIVVEGGGDMQVLRSSFHPLALLVRFVIYPLLLAREYRAKAMTEALLSASDVDWVVVKPSLLVDAPARSRVKVGLEGDRVPITIPRADVAAFMLSQVESTTWVRKTPRIGG